MKIKFPLSRPYFDSDELSELRKVLVSGWISQGPKAREFEEKIAGYLGVKHAVSVINCTAALHLSLLSLGIKTGDEVLVSDYTFPATGNAVAHCGAKPVFVDVELDTYNIDPFLIERRITDRTKAIIPVHAFGRPAKMDEIVKIARKYNLKVVEDAACAFGATYNGRSTGTIGDIGCFSFHARKGITTGEGGVVVTNNKRLADHVRRLSVFGMDKLRGKEGKNRFSISKFIEVGYNYKMSDITAAIGVAQLRKVEIFIEKRQTLARCWDRKLRDMEFITAPSAYSRGRHVYQSYVALLDKRIDRDKVIRALAGKGIETQIGSYASHIQPAYRSKDRCPNSLELFKRALALPIYHLLKEKHIDIVADSIKKTIEEIE